MKRILGALALILSVGAFAQQSLEKGNLQVNAGVGISSWGVPVYAGVDYAITDDITIGGEVSYRSKKEDVVIAKWKHTVFGIAVNGNYHFNKLLNIPSNFDLYAGASIGYYNWNTKLEGTNYYNFIPYSGDYTSGIGFSIQVGGRYFFTEKFGINLEAGGGNVSGGKVGITYKF